MPLTTLLNYVLAVALLFNLTLAAGETSSAESVQPRLAQNFYFSEHDQGRDTADLLRLIFYRQPSRVLIHNTTDHDINLHLLFGHSVDTFSIPNPEDYDELIIHFVPDTEGGYRCLEGDVTHIPLSEYPSSQAIYGPKIFAYRSEIKEILLESIEHLRSGAVHEAKNYRPILKNKTNSLAQTVFFRGLKVASEEKSSSPKYFISLREHDDLSDNCIHLDIRSSFQSVFPIKPSCKGFQEYIKRSQEKYSGWYTKTDDLLQQIGIHSLGERVITWNSLFARNIQYLTYAPLSSETKTPKIIHTTVKDQLNLEIFKTSYESCSPHRRWEHMIWCRPAYIETITNQLREAGLSALVKSTEDLADHSLYSYINSHLYGNEFLHLALLERYGGIACDSECHIIHDLQHYVANFDLFFSVDNLYPILPYMGTLGSRAQHPFVMNVVRYIEQHGALEDVHPGFYFLSTQYHPTDSLIDIVLSPNVLNPAVVDKNKKKINKFCIDAMAKYAS